MTDTYDPTETSLLDAALLNVPFDGWSETTFRAAVAEADVDPVVARALFPRGALDLAMAFHRRGDDEMVRTARRPTDMTDMQFRDKVTLAVRLRLEVGRGSRGGAARHDAVRPADACGGWREADLGHRRPRSGPRSATRPTT